MGQKNSLKNIAEMVWILMMLGVFIYFSGFNGGPLYDLISGQAFRLGTFWVSIKYTLGGFIVTFIVMLAGGIILEKILD